MAEGKSRSGTEIAFARYLLERSLFRAGTGTVYRRVVHPSGNTFGIKWIALGDAAFLGRQGHAMDITFAFSVFSPTPYASFPLPSS